MEYTHRRSNGTLVAGIILISIGFLFILQNFDLIYIGSIWQHWPLVFAVIGIVKVFTMENRKQFGEAIWWIFLGAWLYVSIRNVYGLTFSDTWPAMVIAWGVSIIWKSYTHNAYRLVKE